MYKSLLLEIKVDNLSKSDSLLSNISIESKESVDSSIQFIVPTDKNTNVLTNKMLNALRFNEHLCELVLKVYLSCITDKNTFIIPSTTIKHSIDRY